MPKPVSFRMRISGFGIWRILYVTEKKRWELAYSARANGEQWIPCGHFVAAESAAIAVAERKTGAEIWDGLRFALPSSMELSRWETDASEGVQADARD